MVRFNRRTVSAALASLFGLAASFPVRKAAASAAGDGAVRLSGFSTLDAALAHLHTLPGPLPALAIDAHAVLTRDTIFPMPVQVMPGCTITRGAHAVTFRDRLVADNDRRVFDVDGTGRIAVNQDSVAARWFCDDSAALTPDQAGIVLAQATVAASPGSGAKEVRFGEAPFGQSEPITPVSGVHLRGIKGRSRLKVIKGAFNQINAVGAELNNWGVDGITFDGSVNFPKDRVRTYRGDVTQANTAIRLAPDRLANIHIGWVRGEYLSDGTIDINTDGAGNIRIDDVEMLWGWYKISGVRVRCPSPASPRTRPRDIVIGKITSRYGGPRKWWDPSKEDFCASVDCLQIDKCQDVTIGFVDAFSPAGIGIRIEESTDVRINGASIVEPGQDGVVLYKGTARAQLQNVQVQGWGRTPNALCARKFGNALVYFREFPKVTGPMLPRNPLSGSWYGIWPYAGRTGGKPANPETDPFDHTKLPDYSSLDYYLVRGGILPFRGYAAIAIVQDTQQVTLTNCGGKGELARDAQGKFTHASDYGLSFVHSVNDSAALTPGLTGRGSSVQNVRFDSVRQAAIYDPPYQDPVNRRGLLRAR